MKQGETRDRSLRARRPTGVRQDIALGVRRRQRWWGVGKGSQRTLPALRLRASAPTGACTRLRQPCAAPRGWRELGPARCGGGRPQSPRPISLQLRGPAPSGDTAGRAETPGRLPDACARPRFARRGRARGRREIGCSRHAEADERHINRYLHASNGRESMRDDLEPAPVGQWQPEVQVAEEDVGRDPSSRLPVGQAARWSPSSSRAPLWEAQAPEEHAAEGVILQRKLLACWQRRESEAAAWPSLGEQQSPRRSVKVRKERLKGPLIQAATSCLLPSPCRVAEMARLTGGEPVRQHPREHARVPLAYDRHGVRPIGRGPGRRGTLFFLTPFFPSAQPRYRRQGLTRDPAGRQTSPFFPETDWRAQDKSPRTSIARTANDHAGSNMHEKRHASGPGAGVGSKGTLLRRLSARHHAGLRPVQRGRRQQVASAHALAGTPPGQGPECSRRGGLARS